MKRYFPEAQIFSDSITGVKIRRLTGWLAHSWHIYFTESGWWNNNRCLIFNSHRENTVGIYNIDLESFEIQRIAKGYTAQCLNRLTKEVYCKQGNILGCVKLTGGKVRKIYEADKRFWLGNISCSSDGKWICTVETEDKGLDLSLLHQGYIGFKEYFKSQPLSRIFKISSETGKAEIVLEKKTWIGHINYSPLLPDIITYCHEGPWKLVEQRIWALNISTGQTWPVRVQNKEEQIGHEYWLADGIHIGYHGWVKEQHVFGFVKYDNSEYSEFNIPYDGSNHFSSNDMNMIVGDGQGDKTPFIILYVRNNNAFEPYILCKHRSSRHIQEVHVHPVISPDSKYVLYTSDTTGYGQLYQAFIPENYTSLPSLNSFYKS